MWQLWARALFILGLYANFTTLFFLPSNSLTTNVANFDLWSYQVKDLPRTGVSINLKRHLTLSLTCRRVRVSGKKCHMSPLINYEINLICFRLVFLSFSVLLLNTQVINTFFFAFGELNEQPFDARGFLAEIVIIKYGSRITFFCF